MLSREECSTIIRWEAEERLKWTSLACVNRDTLNKLCDSASDLLKFPNNKEKQLQLQILLKELHEKKIYDVGTVMRNIQALNE